MDYCNGKVEPMARKTDEALTLRNAILLGCDTTPRECLAIRAALKSPPWRTFHAAVDRLQQAKLVSAPGGHGWQRTVALTVRGASAAIELRKAM